MTVLTSVDPQIDVIHSMDDDDLFCFVINSGEFEGVTFTYQDIDIKENESGEANLEFNYVILNNMNNIELNENFENKVGNFLIGIMENSLREKIKEE